MDVLKSSLFNFLPQYILQAKFSNTVSLEKKKEAWASVLEAVNAVNAGEKKTVEQVYKRAQFHYHFFPANIVLKSYSNIEIFLNKIEILIGEEEIRGHDRLPS